jgi:hypothetical protein
MTEPEPRFSETSGFALFCQGSVSFARFFLPVFARFLPSFARFAPFLPENACFLPGFVQFRAFRLVSSKFTRIRSVLFVPCLPGLGHHWWGPYILALILV